MEKEVQSDIERFRQLFDGLDRVHGRYDIDPDLSSRQEKVSGKPWTVKEPVFLSHFEKHIAGDAGLGIVPIRDDQCCVFAALDIDEYDLDLKKLNEDVQKLQLPFVTCRTKSGGAHLYVFFKEPVKAEHVRDRLNKMAEALGFPATEVFPKQKIIKPEDVGNWINLPYFNCPGPTNRYGLDVDGKALVELHDFVVNAESRKISKEAFLKLEIPELEKPFKDGPPCLQRLASAKGGFPQGTRNKSLFNIGVYLREKYQDDWQQKIEEYNHRMINPPLSSPEVIQITKSLSKGKYFYTCDDDPIKRVCARDACLGRKYGIGNSSADGGELEAMLGTLQKTVTLDPYGKELVDEKPEWYMAVDGVMITLQTGELMNQDRFITKLAESMCKFPMKVRPQRWNAMLKEKIESAERVELGPETGTYGHIFTALKDFCTNHGGAETRLEIDTGQVWKDDDGCLWFKHQPFWEFLVRRGIYRAKDGGNELHRMMRILGATKKQLMLTREPKQVNRECWCIKDWTDEDKEQTPDPKVPETEF